MILALLDLVLELAQCVYYSPSVGVHRELIDSSAPSICSLFSVVMLKIRFFLAKSNICISFVILRTTASDSVAFSPIRDI